jgi:hypothetical protein
MSNVQVQFTGSSQARDAFTLTPDLIRTAQFFNQIPYTRDLDLFTKHRTDGGTSNNDVGFDFKYSIDGVIGYEVSRFLMTDQQVNIITGVNDVLSILTTTGGVDTTVTVNIPQGYYLPYTDGLITYAVAAAAFALQQYKDSIVHYIAYQLGAGSTVWIDAATGLLNITKAGITAIQLNVPAYNVNRLLGFSSTVITTHAATLTGTYRIHLDYDLGKSIILTSDELTNDSFITPVGANNWIAVIPNRFEADSETISFESGGDPTYIRKIPHPGGIKITRLRIRLQDENQRVLPAPGDWYLRLKLFLVR